jgi:hypothetical protein
MGILWTAIALVVLWVVAVAVFKVVGFFIHILIIAAVALLIWRAVQKMRGPRSTV